MAKKSTQIRPRRAAGGSLDTVNGAERSVAIEPDDDDEFRVLNSLNAEFSNGEQHDWLCRVFRLISVPGRQPREGWLFDHNVAELRSLRETIAQTKGPGRYRARVVKDNIPFRQYDFDIEVDMRPQTALAAAPATAAPASGFETMFLQMMEQQNQFMRMLAERLTQQPAAAPVVDESERMLKMAQTMKALQELNAPANIGLEMFKEGMNLMKEIAPKGDGGGAGMMDLAQTAIEKMGPVIERMMQQPRPQLPAAQPLAAIPPLPVRSASPAVPARSNAPAAAVPAASNQIPQQIVDLKNYLVIKASEGAQPELLADYVERQLGEQGMSLLEGQDDPLMFLEGLFPDIVPHRGWFTALMDALWPEEETPQADAAANLNSGELSPDTGRTSGDAGNP